MSIYRANAVLCIIFLLSVAGCATTDQKSLLQKQPGAEAVGGREDIYLSVTAGKPIVHDSVKKPIMRYSMTGEKPRVRTVKSSFQDRESINEKWVVVTERSEDGKELGITVTPLVPSDLLRDALREELSAAGYTVRLVNKLPKNVGKGIILTHVSVDVDQVSGLLAVDGSCRLRIGMDLWRNGARLKKIANEFSYSDSAMTERDRLLPDMLNSVIQIAMKQSIPEITKELEH